MSVEQQVRNTFEAIRAGRQHNWVSLHLPGAVGDPAPGPSLYNGSEFMVWFKGYDKVADAWVIEGRSNQKCMWTTATALQVFRAFGLDADETMKRITKWYR